MGVFVKICGLSNQEDTVRVIELQPDAIGFVFWSGSKRAVQPDDVEKWTRNMPLHMRKVGVFVDANEKELREITNVAKLDVVQLHSNPAPDMLHRLRSQVWKAVHLEKELPSDALAYHVDAFLVDSYTAESPGGTGRVNDWDKARDFVAGNKVPVLLAGGLTPDNVKEAIQHVQPWGVDVSSGVEVAPGKKSIERVREFIKACRST